MSASWYIGDDLDDLDVFWRDDAGSLIDFSSGYTFALTLSKNGSTAVGTYFTTATGMTGAAGDLTTTPQVPNLVKAWSTTGELNSLTDAGIYDIEIRATRTADSKIRTFRQQVTIKTVL